jgi:hypothetical protein
MQTNTKTRTQTADTETVVLKVSGYKIEILKFLSKIAKDYMVVRTSQFLPNNDDEREHIYVTIVPLAAGAPSQ